ncbi:unnamed protein product [Polarella glacialis]|uniref:Uncharacterized protein n=1 Tax=Polarella glacialis TaxID=89957 RepID=A0A813DSQ9_POLGL|nr:unnamed protein product [Polarella glacialis]CAE8625177.1 unnamed protein product [Polarella glacialis]CAE8702065.1 unnamed protein product [Polarella glacialis]
MSAALLRRAVARSVQASPQVSPVGRSFATKAASPQTPLLHYTFTQHATSSINHRIFYVNVVAMVFVYDAGSAMLDI